VRVTAAVVGHTGHVDPGERVRWVTETATAVLAGRMSAGEGAQAVRLQADQLVALLRRDRDGVTRRESEAVATRLRLLAEQLTDSAEARDDPDGYLALAEAIGEMAAVLR
jgi:hypothetical protein